MDYSLAWDQAYLEPVIILGLTLFALLGYWVTITNKKLESKFVRLLGEERKKVGWIMFWRYAGFFYYALIPGLVVFIVLQHNAAFYGLSFVNIPESLFWTAGLSIIILLIRNKSTRKPDNTAQYPQIRTAQWDTRLILKNSLGWFIYLLAYEFLFRGLLLFGLLEVFGTWPAILINTIIYSLAHIPKGNREAIAAIPFGIILCILTIRTETIWTSVFVHVALAYSNDYFALAASKTMKFVKNRNV